MGLYAAIDLHSTSNHLGVIDEDDKRVLGRKLVNDPTVILEALQPFKTDLTGVLDLSKHRAETVKKFLMVYGMEDPRSNLN